MVFIDALVGHVPIKVSQLLHYFLSPKKTGGPEEIGALGAETRENSKPRPLDLRETPFFYYRDRLFLEENGS